MQVTGFDERKIVQERTGAHFVVFIYVGGDRPDHSWSVDGQLLNDTDVPQALEWLRENLPADSCWSLGVVVEPEAPTADTELSVRWIVGADVLNMQPKDWSPAEERLAEEMLGRRHRVDLT